jgi:tetrahydromethanopterin S-methyltransferase subunit G
MRLTLKSLQTEMRSSFGAISLRIDKLDANLNDRIDGISLRLDRHIKETAHEFRNIDERFNGIDRRFEKMDQRFDNMDRRFDRLTGEIVDSLSGYFTNIDKMLANHEDRITVLEPKR